MSIQAKNTFFQYLPIYGCISTGLSYIGVGTIAVLSFLKLREGGADESSMLAILNEVIIGKILLWIIMVGTACYIVWRIFEAVTDPYGYGKDFWGLGKRSGIALSTFADLLIVYAAIKVLLEVGDIQQSGEPHEEREFVSKVLNESWGASAMTAMGVVVLVAAVVQLVYGVTRGYKERLALIAIRRLQKPPFISWRGSDIVPEALLSVSQASFYLKLHLRASQNMLSTLTKLSTLSATRSDIYISFWWRSEQCAMASS